MKLTWYPRMICKEEIIMKNMYRVFLLALALVMAFTFTAMAETRNATAFKANGIEIDGDLSDWNLSSPIVVNTKEQIVRDPGQWTGEEDCSFKVYTAWDEENLYIAMEMLDDTPLMYREGFPPDMADTLVLMFSTDPNADPARTEYTATDWRFSQIVDGFDYGYYNGIDRDMIADNKGFETMGPDGDEECIEDMEGAVTEIDGGYIMEIRVPLKAFSNENLPALVPSAGMTIGFEVGMFDLDFPCPGVATVRMQWGGNTEVDVNPSLWGTLTFAE